MEHVSNEQKAKEICHCSECTYKIKSEGDNCMCPRMAAILQAMEWKEKETKDRLTNVLYNHSLNGIIESVKNRYFISLDEFTDFIVKGE